MSEFVFTRTHPLPGGPRVRLRLARPTDRAGVAALLERRDTEAHDLAVRGLLRFDPSRRTVLAAVAPINGSETLIGLAALDHAPGAEVDTFVADARWGDDLAALLAHALSARARSLGRRVA